MKLYNYCTNKFKYNSLSSNWMQEVILYEKLIMAKKEQSVQTNYDYYEMIQCLLNMPSYQQEINLLTMINIANHQQNDHSTLLYKQTSQLYPLLFPIKTINNINIICYREELTIQDNHRNTTKNDSRLDTMVPLSAGTSSRKLTCTIIQYY